MFAFPLLLCSSLSPPPSRLSRVSLSSLKYRNFDTRAYLPTTTPWAPPAALGVLVHLPCTCRYDVADTPITAPAHFRRAHLSQMINVLLELGKSQADARVPTAVHENEDVCVVLPSSMQHAGMIRWMHRATTETMTLRYRLRAG